MTKTTATIADRILTDPMGGDGCARKTRLGVPVCDLVSRIATSWTGDADSVTYTFADGSELECYGDGWDTPEGWAAND